jgi:hypothetical protein
MSNNLDVYGSICYAEVANIVNAMEIVWLKQLMATLKDFTKELPIPDPPPPDNVPLMLIRNEINNIHKIETLRFKYERRVHVDPEGLKDVAILCRETAKLIERGTKEK